MIERHYEDEVLISLLESNRAGADAHLPSCAPCTEKVDSFRTIAGALRDPNVWDSRDVGSGAIPNTLATLRAFAGRMAGENARAEAILPELLAGPRETWLPRLQEHPEWRTAGVVRKLVEKAYDAVVSAPPDAVELTAVAIDIAEHLDPALHREDELSRLRGTAWRDRAYALFYTGQFSAALDAADRADREFAACVVDEYERARVGIVRGLVLRSFERFAEAAEVTAASVKAFERFEDVEKIASARLAEVHLLFSQHDYGRAEAILLDLDQRLENTRHADTHARVLGNLGYCARKTGRIDLATRYFELAGGILSDLGVETEAVRVRWNIAAMLATAGRLTEAYTRLSSITADMERLGMTSEAALNALEIAELLLAESRFAEVEQICASAMRSFERAGLGYSSRAMTALAYMREAAAQRKASQMLVRTVRDYIRRLPAQPNLLFAPAPEPR